MYRKVIKKSVIFAPERPVHHAPVQQSAYSRGAWKGEVACPWDKITYARWVETVKSEFKPGDLICMRGSSVFTNPKQAPFYYTIESIQEIHYLVKFDTHYDEPLCLNVVTAAGFRMSRAPSSIRKLTNEELDLVYISDKASKFAHC